MFSGSSFRIVVLKVGLYGIQKQRNKDKREKANKRKRVRKEERKEGKKQRNRVTDESQSRVGLGLAG